MNYLYFDIESVGDRQWLEEAIAQIEPPSNYVKEEAKDKYREREATKIAERLALDATFAQIVAIGFALNEGDIKTVVQVGDQNEAWVLHQFWEVLTDQYEHHSTPGSTQWVGHNVRRFDLPFLVARHLLYEMVPKMVIPVGRSRAVHDTLEIYQGLGKPTANLDTLRKVFGLADAHGSGGDVADWYETGQWQEIDAHVRADVAATRELHQRLLAVAEVG